MMFKALCPKFLLLPLPLLYLFLVTPNVNSSHEFNSLFKKAAYFFSNPPLLQNPLKIETFIHFQKTL